ncbi:MAG: hypothetical protein MJ082_05500 [Clostridia bacterium]|nr:hypothetical protein [Clostridia bacterium]
MAKAARSFYLWAGFKTTAAIPRSIYGLVLKRWQVVLRSKERVAKAARSFYLWVGFE